jgi:hypothetical protein
MTKRQEPLPRPGKRIPADRRVGDSNDVRPGGEGNSEDGERGQPGLDRPGQGTNDPDAAVKQLDAMKAIDA